MSDAFKQSLIDYSNKLHDLDFMVIVDNSEYFIVHDTVVDDFIIEYFMVFKIDYENTTYTFITFSETPDYPSPLKLQEYLGNCDILWKRVFD